MAKNSANPWRNICIKLNRNDFEFDNEELDEWHKAWSQAANAHYRKDEGFINDTKKLAWGILKLPILLKYSPKVSDMVKVLLNLLSLSDTDVVLLENVSNIINNRLIPILQSFQVDKVLLQQIINLKDQIVDKLELKFLARTNLSRIGLLIMKSSFLGDFITSQSLSKELNTCRASFLGWQTNPTIGWLVNDELKKDLYDLKPLFDTTENYAKSLLKIWSAFTFYWGAASMWPRCNHASNDKNCNEPMIKYDNSGLTCREENCYEPAEWRCYHKKHDVICKKCLKRLQSELMSAPGQQASTDIYDAQVTAEAWSKNDSLYLLDSVCSRKPPKVEPNWNTSYRLSSSGLVAIAKLKKRGEGLSEDMHVQWAELVHMDDNKWKKKYAIRLLNGCDCELMESNTLQELGNNIAIIDMRVFVPECISVLNTFSKKKFLHNLEQLPILNKLLVAEEENFIENVKCDSIEVAIKNSNLQVMCQMSEQNKNDLIQELYENQAIQKLQGSQLKAFCESLRSELHCTIGPPGTGKSYIGMCLVLALDLIRKKLEFEGKCVGPILVLSYKNHSLDEFLLDIIENMHDIKSGMLIRTGSSDKERLQDYLEHNLRSKYASGIKINLETVVTVKRIASKTSKFWFQLVNQINNGGGASVKVLDDFAQATCAAFCWFYELYEYVKEINFDQLESEQAFFYLHLKSSNGKIVDFGKSIEGCKLILTNLVKDPKSKLLLKNKTQEIYDVLRVWLRQSMPPPKCDLMSCEKRADNFKKYCSTHQCHSVGCSALKARGNYCDSHLCKFEIQCNEHKFDQTEYCNKHVCVGCLLEKPQTVQSILTTSAACQKHSCQYEGKCANPCVLPYHFCEHHLCLECAESGDLTEIAETGVYEKETRFNMKHKFACSPIDYTGPKDLSTGKRLFTEWPKIIGRDFCAYHICSNVQCNAKRLYKSKYEESLYICFDHFAEKIGLVKNWVTSDLIPNGAFQLFKCDECEFKIYYNNRKPNRWLCPLHEKKYSYATAVMGEQQTNNLETLDTSCDDSLEDEEDMKDRLQDTYEMVEREIVDVLQMQQNNQQPQLKPFESIIQMLKKWSWQIDLSERISQATGFLLDIVAMVDKLSELSEPHLNDIRKDLAINNATIYKKARIVGSTVTSASKRLAALQACEPFAIVVEEACEVLEPTLVSTLVFNSLQKLELIGDHRQLPAYVQKYWFNFEMNMSWLKMSLFERLVTVSKISHTILDEQRRMCPSVADITRKAYSDMVAIVDHQVTRNQKIGDRYKHSLKDVDTTSFKRFEAQQAFWHGKGYTVPGSKSNIFFWDIRDSHESSEYGASVCNPTEAKHVVALTKWFLLCGCPPSSITIITPYNGQIKCLTNELKVKKCPQVQVVSIDRFQGDENDIIILSMVRTTKENKFLLLANRFIVAMSRARLGLFIVGSKKALSSDSSDLWLNLIENLTKTDRCGNFFTICCPQHGLGNQKQIITLNDFPTETNWLDFCVMTCNERYKRCNHECKHPCHANIYYMHPKCMVEMDRDCDYHNDIKILCHTFQERNINFKGKVEFKCDIKIKEWKRPGCGHVFRDLTCNQIQHYEQQKRCYQKTREFTRKCGCTVMTYCTPAENAKSPDDVMCFIKALRPRPRCDHDILLTCNVYQELVTRWRLKNGINGDSTHDQRLYSCSESKINTKVSECQALVNFRPVCGHFVRNVQCSTRYNYIQNIQRYQCPQQTKQPCPICKSPISLLCWQKEILEKWVTGFNYYTGYLTERDLESCPKPDFDMDFINTIQLMCTSRITVQKTCSQRHDMSISCKMIIKHILGALPFEECKIKFSPPISYKYHCEQRLHSLRFDSCNEMTNFLNTVPKCLANIKFTRRCKHETFIACHLKKQFLEKESLMEPCQMCPDYCVNCFTPVYQAEVYNCHGKLSCHSCLLEYLAIINAAVETQDKTRLNPYLTKDEHIAWFNEKEILMDLHDYHDSTITRAFNSLKKKVDLLCVTRKAYTEAQENQTQTFEAFYKNKSQIDLLVTSFWNEMNEKILLLKCPKCKAIFYDFDACGVLQCLHCSTHFCCFCFQTGTETSVHTHLPKCEKNTKGSLFVIDEFHSYHNKRRQIEALEYIRKLEVDDSVRKILDSMLEKHDIMNKRN